MSRLGVIAVEMVDRCELCKTIAETRPYGANGEEVCFKCAMEDQISMREQAARHLFGEGLRRNKVRKITGGNK